MQRHRNAGQPQPLPDPKTTEFRAQHVLILELVVAPPADGDRVDDLARRLDLSLETLQAAIAALEAVGLAWSSNGMVRATQAALHFEHLWPVAL